MSRENAFLGALALAIVACGVAARWCLVTWRARGDEGATLAKVLFSALVTVLSLLMMLLGLEVYYRFVYDATDSFALMKTSQLWFERHYQLNSWQVRDDVEYEDEHTSAR